MATFPGIHSGFEIAAYPAYLHRAIRKISASFYITKSFNPITVGNSQYLAILARPTEEFSVYVNTDREIVVLFSPYENFEIRTLEAYEKFYALLDSARIDKSVRFLVSEDEKIETIIRHYLDQHPEYPIIIPTTLNNIISKDGNSLLEAVRRNYLLRDLFGYQNPLREETFFFGRQKIVNSVLDMAKSGQNSSLFGLRKSGKTSAIYAIQRKAKAFSCSVSLIDCQDPKVHAKDYASLLSHIIGEVRKSLGLKRINIELGKTPSEISENFTTLLNNTLSSSKGISLIIFDEIENISPRTASSPHWKEGNDIIYFWQIIRSYIQSESQGRISLCIVGTSPHILELSRINNIANPIYLFAQKQFIPNLTFDETREMVERLGYFMGLEFPPTLIGDLQKEFGGHPFFTRQVCSKVHQLASSTRPLKVSSSLLDRAKTEFSGQLESYLRDIIEELSDSYPDEYELLRAVVDGNKDDLSEFGREAPDLIDHLIGYGLVERSGNEYDIRFNAIKSVLERVVGAGHPDERWAEISKRRNNLERNIRICIYHWSKSVDSAEWTNILSKNLTKNRLENLPGTEPSILFSSKISPLYLSDLMMILKDDRVLPHILDRRSMIIKNLHEINQLRKDAHAIEVSHSDIEKARLSFTLLEDEFDMP